MAPSTKFALGAGCYWGTEKYIVKDFQELFPGSIASAAVGFMSPFKNAIENPSYRQVCTGETSHVEVLDITLSDSKYFEDIIKFFFQFHDPTTKHRQGNDVGTQYSSIIFCSDVEQKQICNAVMMELQQAVDHQLVTTYQLKKVETEVADYTTFYAAHEEHQQYLFKNPTGYCNHRYRFKSWPKV